MCNQSIIPIQTLHRKGPRLFAVWYCSAYVIMPGTRNDYLDLIPLELWGKILLNLEGGVGEGLCPRYLDPRTLFEEQFQFHRLRAVRRRFRDAFYPEPLLSRGLVLSPTLPPTSLYSLIAWVKAYGKFVRTLAVDGMSRDLYATLKALDQDGSDLCSVFLSNNDAYLSMRMLSPFTTLTSCEIINPEIPEKHPAFDISPLSSLPKLEKLFLSDGTFTSTQLLIFKKTV